MCCMCGRQYTTVRNFLSHLFDAHKVNLKLDPTAIWNWRCPLCPRAEPACGLLQAHLNECAMHFKPHLLLAPATASTSTASSKAAYTRGLIDDDLCYLFRDPQHMIAPMPPPRGAIAPRDPLVLPDMQSRIVQPHPLFHTSIPIRFQVQPAPPIGFGNPGPQRPPKSGKLPVLGAPNYGAAMNAASRPPPPPLPSISNSNSKSKLNSSAVRAALKKHTERNKAFFENRTEPSAREATRFSTAAVNVSGHPANSSAGANPYEVPVIDLNLARAATESARKLELQKQKSKQIVMKNKCIRK